MANSKSAKKRVLVAERNRLRNRDVKGAFRTAIKRVIEALDNNADDVTELVNVAYGRLDKAVTKGVIHKNTAGRYKSRLMAKVNEAKKAS
jgi:small subunit ribosomal protein S20